MVAHLLSEDDDDWPKDLFGHESVVVRDVGHDADAHLAPLKINGTPSNNGTARLVEQTREVLDPSARKDAVRVRSELAFGKP